MNLRARPLAAWLLTALLAACASSPSPRPQGRAPATEGASREVAPPSRGLAELGGPLDAVQPPTEDSRVGATLSIPLDAIRALIDREVPAVMKHGWQRLTPRGKSPELDARYVIEREPMKLSMDGSRLRVELPLRYHADLRGRVRVPFVNKWLPLAGDLHWGTARDPQRVTLAATVELSLAEDYALRVGARALPPAHGKPPGGKACVKAGISVCVAKDGLAPEVRKRLDGEITPRLAKALAQLERRLRGAVDTRGRVQALWATASCPWSLTTGAPACKAPAGEPDGAGPDAWLRFVPERVGVGSPRLTANRGKANRGALEIDASIDGTTTVVAGAWPGAATPKLPAPSKGARAGFDLAFHAELPYDVIAAAAADALARDAIPVGQMGKLRVTHVALAGRRAPDGSPRLLLEVHIEGAVRGIIHLWGRPMFDPKSQILCVADLDYTLDTQDRFAKGLSEINHDALRAELTKRAVFDVAPRAEQLRAAMGAAMSRQLAGGLRSEGEVKQLSLLSPVLSSDRVLLPVRLDGLLRVTAKL